MDLASSISTPTRGVGLDSPPPQTGNFMTVKPQAPQGAGLGELANSPELMTMQGMAMVKDGFQLLSRGIPALAQLLSGTLNDLEQMVAQGMSNNMAGTLPSGPAGPAPPGVAPMQGPPPPGVGGGGPPQGM